MAPTQMTSKEREKLRNLQSVASTPLTRKSNQKTYESLIKRKLAEIYNDLESGELLPHEAKEKTEDVIKQAYLYAKVNGVKLSPDFMDYLRLYSDEKTVDKIETYYHGTGAVKPSRYSIFKGARAKQTSQASSTISKVADLEERAQKKQLSKEELLKTYREELGSQNPRNAVLSELHSIGLDMDRKLGDVLVYHLPDKKKAREAKIEQARSALDMYEEGMLDRTPEGQLYVYEERYNSLSDAQKKSPTGQLYRRNIERLKAKIETQKEEEKRQKEARTSAIIKKQEEEKALAEKRAHEEYLDKKAKFEADAPKRAREAAAESKRIEDEMMWSQIQSSDARQIHPHANEIENA